MLTKLSNNALVCRMFSSLGGNMYGLSIQIPRICNICFHPLGEGCDLSWTNYGVN